VLVGLPAASRERAGRAASCGSGARAIVKEMDAEGRKLAKFIASC
jgi:hypothetical protein